MRNKRRGNSKRRKTGEGESSSRFIKMQKSRGIAKISFSRIAANLFGFVSLAWRVSGIAFLSLLEGKKILKLEREREKGEQSSRISKMNLFPRKKVATNPMKRES